jgi:hypothetical protein
MNAKAIQVVLSAILFALMLCNVAMQVNYRNKAQQQHSKVTVPR